MSDTTVTMRPATTRVTIGNQVQARIALDQRTTTEQTCGPLGLGTAAYQDTSAFDAAGVSAAETVRAIAAEAANTALITNEATTARPIAVGGTGQTTAVAALAALGGVTSAQAAAAAPVQSVAGRTGEVAIAAGDVSGLAAVATTGAYSSLSGLPTLADKLTPADVLSDFVVAGLLSPTSANLSSILAAGVAYVTGLRTVVGATSFTYTASKDTYDDLASSGIITHVAVANGAVAPAIIANNLRLQKVVSSGTAITAVTNLAPNAQITLPGGNGIALKLKGAGFSTTTRDFNAGVYAFTGVNLPGSSRPDAVFSMGWNVGANGAPEDNTDACLRMAFEDYFLQGGALPARYEWHLSMFDTSAVEHRPITMQLRRDGISSNNGTSCSFQFDKFSINDYAQNQVLIVDSFLDVISIAKKTTKINVLGNNYAFLQQMNATGTAFLQLPFYDGDNAVRVPSSFRAVGATPTTGTYPNTFFVVQPTTLAANGVVLQTRAPAITGSFSAAQFIGSATQDMIAGVYNNANNATANSVFELRAVAAGSGDCIVRYNVSGATQWTVGLDNSDADKFKWGLAALGSNDKMTLDTSGRLGIGTNSPTAVVHTKAGTATAGTAPQKFNAGVLLTTTEIGAEETDASAIRYYTDGTATRRRYQTTNFTTAVSAITPGASPYVYQNTSGYDADVLTTGGTVSLIEFSRDGTTYYAAGITSGSQRLSPLDSIRVTYSAAPTMTAIPR